MAGGIAAGAQAAGVQSAPGPQFVTAYHEDGATCELASPEFRQVLEARAVAAAAARRGVSAVSVDRLDENLDPSEAFELTLNGFTDDAEAAYRRAVEIWAQVLDVQVPVTVVGSFAPDDPNTLGSGGPGCIFRAFPGAPDPNLWHAAALAQQVAGGRFQSCPGGFDISTSFNSIFTDFYFGLDGNPPPGQFDFVSVVLHELGHGLGFSDSTCVNPQSPGCQATQAGHGAFGIGAQNLPSVFDNLLETGDGGRIVDLANPSAELGAALVGGDLFFGGTSATEANDNQRPKVYAPSPFSPGGSIAHFDELTFGFGTPDGLMTPFISPGEVLQDVGAITLGLYEDLGWRLGAERVLHFAQFGNGGGFQSAVVVVNPSEAVAASGTVDFFDEDGNPVDPALFLESGDNTFNLPPRGSQTFATTGAGNLVLGSAVVRSDRPVSGVLRFTIDLNDIGVAGVGAGLVASAVITPVRLENGAKTGIAIRNVNSGDVTVKLRLFTEDGALVTDADPIVIPGNARISKFIDELFGASNVPEGFRGSVTIEVEGEGRIAVIALELGGPGQFATLPVAAIR